MALEATHRGTGVRPDRAGEAVHRVRVSGWPSAFRVLMRADPRASAGRRYRRSALRSPLAALTIAGVLIGAPCWTRQDRSVVIAALPPGRRHRIRLVAATAVVGVAPLVCACTSIGLLFGLDVLLGVLLALMLVAAVAYVRRWDEPRLSGSLHSDAWDVLVIAQSGPGRAAVPFARRLLATLPAGSQVWLTAATRTHARLYSRLGFAEQPRIVTTMRQRLHPHADPDVAIPMRLTTHPNP